jgi:hypothetical protein
VPLFLLYNINIGVVGTLADLIKGGWNIGRFDKKWLDCIKTQHYSQMS